MATGLVVVDAQRNNYCVCATSRGDLGFTVILPSGAHATYDDGAHSAADISAAVEKELSEAGVRVVPVPDVTFP
jgi:hypothetical protein